MYFAVAQKKYNIKCNKAHNMGLKVTQRRRAFCFVTVTLKNKSKYLRYFVIFP